MFGSAVYRIDSDKIDFERIDFDRIDSDRIDLCLDAIMQNGLNIMIVVWIVLIKIVFEYIITKIDIVKYKLLN